jgi:hypothetical protein
MAKLLNNFPAVPQSESLQILQIVVDGKTKFLIENYAVNL